MSSPVHDSSPNEPERRRHAGARNDGQGYQEAGNHDGEVGSWWNGRRWPKFDWEDKPTASVVVRVGSHKRLRGGAGRGREKFEGSSVKVTVGSLAATAGRNGWNWPEKTENTGGGQRRLRRFWRLGSTTRALSVSSEDCELWPVSGNG